MAKRMQREIMSISVPPSLRQRMNKIRDVNWSAVARRAFEAELAKINQESKGEKMNDVVRRLRKSRLEAKPEMYQDGFRFGYRWAEKAAAFHDLQRLEQLAHAHRDDPSFDWGPFLGECSAKRSGGKLKQRPDFGEYFNDSEFVFGFVDGAMEVWNTVKSEV